MEKDNYTCHLKLSKDEYDKLKNIATNEYRTINNLLYKLVIEYMKEKGEI